MAVQENNTTATVNGANNNKPRDLAVGQEQALSHAQASQNGQANTIKPDGPKTTGGKTIERLKKQQRELTEQWEKKKSGMLSSGHGPDLWQRGMQMLEKVLMNSIELGKVRKNLKNIEKQFKQINASNTFNKAKHMSNKEGVPMSQALHTVLRQEFKEKKGKEPTRRDMKKSMRTFYRNFLNAEGKHLTRSQKDALKLKDEDFAQQQRTDKEGNLEFDKDGEPVMEYTNEIEQEPERQQAADSVLDTLVARNFDDTNEKTVGNDNTPASDNAPTPTPTRAAEEDAAARNTGAQIQGANTETADHDNNSNAPGM